MYKPVSNKFWVYADYLKCKFCKITETLFIRSRRTGRALRTCRACYLERHYSYFEKILNDRQRHQDWKEKRRDYYKRTKIIRRIQAKQSKYRNRFRRRERAKLKYWEDLEYRKKVIKKSNDYYWKNRLKILYKMRQQKSWSEIEKRDLRRVNIPMRRVVLSHGTSRRGPVS